MLQFITCWSIQEVNRHDVYNLLLSGSEKEKLDKEIWHNGSIVESSWRRGYMVKHFFFIKMFEKWTQKGTQLGVRLLSVHFIVSF